MVWKPHVTVAAVIEQENRFLLVEERVSGEIVINQPAGHLDENEDLLSAVIRETREETAYSFQPEYLTGVYLWQQPRNGETFLRIGFGGNVTGHDAAAALDEGIIQAVWLSREALLESGLKLRSPMVLRCIDDYLAGNRFPLELIEHIENP